MDGEDKSTKKKDDEAVEEEGKNPIINFENNNNKNHEMKLIMVNCSPQRQRIALQKIVKKSDP